MSWIQLQTPALTMEVTTYEPVTVTGDLPSSQWHPHLPTHPKIDRFLRLLNPWL